METRKTFAYTLGCCAVLLVSIQVASAGTTVSKDSTSASSSVDSSPRGGWGWGYPTGYSFSHGLSSFGLPLILIPLIYFGFLWCVVLFGIAAFHQAPVHHSHGHGGGWRSASGGPSHGRYRRDDYSDDYYTTQQRVMSSL